MRKALKLLRYRGRWRLAALLTCVVMMALFETLGVASILPFMSLVANPSVALENPWMASAYSLLGFTSHQEFLFWAGITVLALITFSNAATAFTSWLLLRFTWNTNHELSQRLLRKYLSEPYSFHLQRNTATLNNTLLAEVAVVINGVFIPGLRMIASSVVVVFLLILLFTVDPVLSGGVAVVLGGAYGLVYAVVRRRQGILGRKRIAANAERFQIAAEALGGIKDVKVLGRERLFLDRFAKPSREFSRTSASNAMAAQLPRYALETVAFGGILLVVLYFLQVRQDVDQVLPIVSLYAFAGYRLMPSLQQVFVGLTNVRFNVAALNRLYEDLEGGDGSPDRVPRRFAADQPTPLPFTREIRFERVTFRYADAERAALEDIDLTIPRNQSLGLVGATGSGKTTLVDLLLGLHAPTSGRILIDGVPLDATTIGGWRPHLGYVPQNIFLCDDTILRNVAFGVPDSGIDREAAERACRMARLDEFIATLPAGYETIVGERGVRLSGGQRQRIGIARALYHDPDVLVFDEATSALDGVTENAVMHAIQSLAGRKTIVLIAHRLTTVRACDRIALLDAGRVAAVGTFDQLHAGNPIFRAMAGHPSASAPGEAGPDRYALTRPQ